jgi:DNA-binding GntR family transcriptional regulator
MEMTRSANGGASATDKVAPPCVIEPLRLPDGERAPGAIYEYLRKLILDGELAPHSVISQVQLAGQLGVSRTPLREALRRLQQEGLIEAEPNRKARVVGFDARDLEIVYTGRLLYEPLGIAMTVPRLGDTDVEAIHGKVEEMRAAKARDDYPAWEIAHRDFHRSVVMHAGAPLLQTIESFADRGDRYRRVVQGTHSGAWNYWDTDHELIAEACGRRETREASIELARHLARTALALIAAFRPDYNPAQVRTALSLVAAEPE